MHAFDLSRTYLHVQIPLTPLSFATPIFFLSAG